MKSSQPSTFPLTPPFTPSSSSWSDETHYDDHHQHSAPLERVDSFDLDGSVARSYDWEESDGSGSESEGEEHVDEPMDEPLGGGGKASLSPMDGGRLGTLDEEDNEGDADALQEREKGAGGSAKLRVVIVTENFLPKVDGVTRTLARLLEHLHNEGHEALLCGPETGMSHYASHPLVGTLGIPLVVYPGLKLNFLRPKFMREIEEFKPDVIHMVDPIWLGGQTLMGLELGWAGEKWTGEKGPGVGGGVRGAVVASYHTNLATYATLFGLPWLEPVIWIWQRWLYSKCRLYLCPSQSTMDMLDSHSLPNARMWSRGVDLTHFNPGRRSETLRASWGITPTVLFKENEEEDRFGQQQHTRHVSGLATPPESPALGPVDATAPLNLSALSEGPISFEGADNQTAILYVGRISWEKNLHLLLRAHAQLLTLLAPSGTRPPKLIFVGDGPARAELEATCLERKIDARFLGHQTGTNLAECYASADLFAFPSFTETFGQVVLEALASGLPVVGLDAEGTRDLVRPSQTGHLLPLPPGARDWPAALRSGRGQMFNRAAADYAALLARGVLRVGERREMGRRAASGTQGRTWHEAMEMCVSSYREAITISQSRASLLQRASLDHRRRQNATVAGSGDTKRRPIRAKVGRVLGRLRGSKSGSSFSAPGGDHETLWKLKTLTKVLILLYLLYIFYTTIGASATVPPTIVI